MDTICSYAKADAFPALMDATSLGMFDSSLREFKTATAERAIVAWFNLLVRKRTERWSLSSETTTELSEVRVLLSALDATEDS